MRTEKCSDAWLDDNCDSLEAIAKATDRTRAWFAVIDWRECFVKWYPTELRQSWAKVESAIAGINRHPAIIPLRRKVECADGVLFLYDRMKGENLGPMETRSRFAALPLAERI